MGDSSDVPKPKVVVTGFGPFGNHVVNASSCCVRELEQIWSPGDASLVTIPDIDVLYDTVKDTVPEIWEAHHPTLMVHIGVSGIAKQLTLEQLAHNDGYDKPDNSKSVPSQNCCMEGAIKQCVLSKLDMSKVCDAVNDTDCDVEAVVSHDPGRYLCDFIYYTSLSMNDTRTAFIHVPPLDKPYSKEKLANGIKLAILAMLKQLESK